MCVNCSGITGSLTCHTHFVMNGYQFRNLLRREKKWAKKKEQTKMNDMGTAGGSDQSFVSP